ncbi:MAG: tail fiber domain-containing protein, partial [Planctomycetota bacterium]
HAHRCLGVAISSAVTTTDAAGVFGQSSGTTGAVYGVRGSTASSNADAAGVFGSASAGGNSGVLGSVDTGTGVGVQGRNTNNSATASTSIGVKGTAANTSATANTNASRGVSGEFTGTSGFGYGVYGTSASSNASTAGVFGTVTSTTANAYAGVHGQIPSTGSSAAYGVKGENLNTSGGVGVYAYTAASSGRSILATGSVMIENRSANGSATSAADGLIVWSNSGASGFNASGALFTPSDRNVKNTFTAVDEGEVLEKLANLPVTKWHYRNDDKTWYMGPMAQDFQASFGLGDKDTVIHTVNADGVALAAIKGLNTKVEDKSKALEARLSQLESRVVLLEQALDASHSLANGRLGLGMAIIGVPAVAYRLSRRRRS